MSLQLHLSARSDELLATLRPHLAAARKTTLETCAGIPRPIPVLLPSAQLGDWLQVQLARDLGLSMGFEFLQPGIFFRRHFSAGAAAAEFANSHAFWTPDQLRWQLLPTVDRFTHNLGLDPSATLVPRDRFAFAQLLAQQFDRYARYRPDWPARWDTYQPVWARTQKDLPDTVLADEVWQRALWHSLAVQPDIPPHPARLLGHLGAAQPEQTEPVTPLFIVGTDRLDPLFLRTLQTLSHQGQVIELYLLLPSLGYLGDVSRRNRLRTQLASNSDDAVIEGESHPLLASLGQQAVGTFLLLETLTQDYAEWPTDGGADDEVAEDGFLLQHLQSDIRLQRRPAGPPSAANQPDLRPCLQPDDASLRVHCCHSPRRELEVLRDELLRAFAELPGLQPEDVLVAVTDFDAYAPLAEAILRSGPNNLPVRLTAVPTREANPIAVALLALLRLSLGRHTASDLVELLNLAAIQQHLDLAGETAVLAQLADAIRNSGLTHGLDSTERSTGDTTGTWRTALDRHLAGSWFGPVASAQDTTKTFVHPLAADLHHNDATLMKFVGWLTQLARHLHIWNQPAPATEWANRLEATVDDLLQSEVNDDHTAALLRLLGELASVEAATPLDAGTMLDWLQPQLDNATSLHTSMSGEIMFGRLDQLHGLPCRVLAILGLQDGAFPRAARRPAWDLLAHRPERSDGDPRTQDRQWFLDSILTPSDRLILSAANRSLRTPHDGPLSSCVEELLRVAADTVRPTDGFETLQQQVVMRHRIQPFATEYFTAGNALPRSFNVDAARISTDITRSVYNQPKPFFTASTVDATMSVGDSLSLAQLIAFWKNPAQAWLKTLQLEIQEDETDDNALDDAPVTLDSLQAYAVRAEALALHLAPTSSTTDAESSRLAADRALPPGALGVLAWELRENEIVPLKNGLTPLMSQVSRMAIDFTLTPNIRLTGELMLASAPEATPWILSYRPSKYVSNPKYQLEAFIQTLAATVHLGQPVTCRVLGLDLPTPKELPAIPLDEARHHLTRLVTGYWEGQQRPICYAPESSNVLAVALARGNDASSALEQAKSNWSKEPFFNSPGGEGTTTVASLVWRDGDAFAPPYDQAWLALANEIATPLSNWWSGRTGDANPAPTSQKLSRKKA